MYKKSVLVTKYKVPKRECVFTDSSNEQYPSIKDNGSGSGSGHLRSRMSLCHAVFSLSQEMGRR